MRVSRSVWVAVCVACAAPAFAKASREKQVWITLGTDALEPVRGAFQGKGLTLAAPTFQKGGVAVLRMSESHVEQLARVMHDRLNRCAGFITHDSQAEAFAAVEADNASQSSQWVASLISYNINNAPSVNALLDEVQETELRGTINSLSTNWTNRYYDVQSGADASIWLKNKWTTLTAGRSDITVELFPHAFQQSSVIATIPGTTLPDEVVVLGGHLDSINLSDPVTGTAPGADDDASGVASVTEVLRVAVLKGYKPARTVKFMAYAGEEVGLLGSKAIADSFKASGVNVVGVLQLDMTNYKGNTFDFGLVVDRTNAALNTQIRNLVATYQPGLTVVSAGCGYACSDHASWTSAGYPASMPFEASLSTMNPNIHTAQDTLAFMGGTAANSVKFAKLGASFVAEVAKGATEGNTPPPTGDGGENPGGGGAPGTAVFDATYKAPRCAEAGPDCDSGSLLNGRAGLGPELNTPNTLNAGCMDGTSGSYLGDESIEKLKVSTTDGTNLAAGKTVKIEATVYAYSTTEDALDLYYTENATSPSWTFIGTYSPSSTGVTTLSATYTLPAGGVQAIRANFRYIGSSGTNGSASLCSSGAYDDHDDLVFTVR
ncbi:M20/M25/M40 family metallo-hydrolase [Cystobacter fuscus]|uniref:M20/M25/M40 family metallo-hydrolase n=1 Tax=Cystobacter fuscus TaxID=43 RepID=UPI002B29A6BA|nr:M20/M25/M40 family metallo-hydrolase [Cystobacter fuscus]